jgi:hypothetical protein
MAMEYSNPFDAACLPAGRAKDLFLVARGAVVTDLKVGHYRGWLGSSEKRILHPQNARVRDNNSKVSAERS